MRHTNAKVGNKKTASITPDCSVHCGCVFSCRPVALMKAHMLRKGQIMSLRKHMLMLAMPALLLSSMIASAMSAPAYASSSQANPSPTSHLWGIIVYGPHKTVVSHWKGSYAEYQHRLAAIFKARTKVRPQQALQVHPLINRVSCTSGAFYNFFDEWGNETCFANSGKLGPLNIFNISVVSTGNNTGMFSQIGGNLAKVCTPDPWTSYVAPAGGLWSANTLVIPWSASYWNGGCANIPQ
jgi:hypothetical protein